MNAKRTDLKRRAAKEGLRKRALTQKEMARVHDVSLRGFKLFLKGGPFPKKLTVLEKNKIKEIAVRREERRVERLVKRTMGPNAMAAREAFMDIGRRITSKTEEVPVNGTDKEIVLPDIKETDIKKRIASYTNQLFYKYKLTYQDLANVLQIGSGRLLAYSKGKETPGVRVLIKMAALGELSLDELVLTNKPPAKKEIYVV